MIASSKSIVPPALLVGLGFMSSTLVTPLYQLYRTEYGFSEITLTLVYATYVVGNLAALLWFGAVSDRAGRKPVALSALVLAAGSTALFILSHGTVWLFAARLLSGFAVGLASGTGTAWLADCYGAANRARATLAATCANLMGAAVGPLLSGVLAQYAPMPLQLSFYAYLLLVLGGSLAVLGARETITPTRDRPLRIAPRIGVPANVRGRFIAPAVGAFGSWALGGFYFALLPGLLKEELGIKNLAVAGGIVCEMILAALLTTIFTRRVTSERAMIVGLLMQIPSVAILVLAQVLTSLPLLLIGSTITGIALGEGYRGSLQVVNELAPETERAALLSAFFAVIFVGNSVPVIGIGIISTLASALAANIVFACTIATFAVAAVATRARYMASHLQ